MAMGTFLAMKINDTDIEGESTTLNMGDEDVSKLIECLNYTEGVEAAREGSSGRVTGRRTHLPITFTKRIDKSTPLISISMLGILRPHNYST